MRFIKEVFLFSGLCLLGCMQGESVGNFDESLSVRRNSLTPTGTPFYRANAQGAWINPYSPNGDGTATMNPSWFPLENYNNLSSKSATLNSNWQPGMNYTDATGYVWTPYVTKNGSELERNPYWYTQANYANVASGPWKQGDVYANQTGSSWTPITNRRWEPGLNYTNATSNAWTPIYSGGNWNTGYNYSQATGSDWHGVGDAFYDATGQFWIRPTTVTSD